MSITRTNCDALVSKNLLLHAICGQKERGEARTGQAVCLSAAAVWSVNVWTGSAEKVRLNCLSSDF